MTVRHAIVHLRKRDSQSCILTKHEPSPRLSSPGGWVNSIAVAFHEKGRSSLPSNNLKVTQHLPTQPLESTVVYLR